MSVNSQLLILWPDGKRAVRPTRRDCTRVDPEMDVERERDGGGGGVRDGGGQCVQEEEVRWGKNKVKEGGGGR